jgi:hypothetical protein
MDAQFKEAITLATEISKQLMTLATGILAVTVTVVTNFARRISVGQLWVLIPAWLCYLATILFALWHLSALTGNLLKRPVDPLITSARIPASLQIITYGAGTMLIVAFAIWAGIAIVRDHRRKQQITPDASISADSDISNPAPPSSETAAG